MCIHVKSVQMCSTLRPPWTVNCQAPLSVGFSRQEYCSGLPCPPPGDLPNLRTEPLFLRSPALAGKFFNRHHLGSPLLRIKWSHSAVSNSLQPHGLCNLPDSSVHGILQARVLEWVAISFSRGSSRPRDWTWVSRLAGRRFNLWATREAQLWSQYLAKICY